MHAIIEFVFYQKFGAKFSVIRIQIQIESMYLEFAIKVSNKEYDKQIFC